MPANLRASARSLLAIGFATLLLGCGTGSSDDPPAPQVYAGIADAVRAEYAVIAAAPAAATGAAAGGANDGGTNGGTGGATAKLSSADGRDLSDPQLADFAARFLATINAVRAEPRRCGERAFPAVASLRWNVRVAYAALLQSEWMKASNTVEHAWPSGERVWSRLAQAGYAWVAADETLAAGYGSIDATMLAWLASPGHCAALMRDDVVDVGVAVVAGDDSNDWPSYWTMVVATPVR